jgi:hypothetical protein
MAQFILGGLCRSLRPLVCDGRLARFQNRLSNEARCVEAMPVLQNIRFNSLIV